MIKIEHSHNKIVIFDWGGVIENHKNRKYNIYEAILKIIKHFNVNMPNDEIITKYLSCETDNSNKSINTYNNIKDIEKWFTRIKTIFNINCTFRYFMKIYNEEFAKVEYNLKLVELAHSIKKYCDIGLLSNLSLLDKERLNSQVDLKKFDYVWLSFELGIIKPNKKIYKIVERDCKLEPNNILFIDDSYENIKVAKTRKWNTLQATGDEFNKIKSEIFRFLNVKS